MRAPLPPRPGRPAPTRRGASTWRAAVAVALALAALPAGAIDGDAMTRDLVRLHGSATRRDFVCWLPTAAMATLMPDSTPEQLRMFTRMMTGYEMFMVARMRVDAAGGMAPLDDGTANDHVRLRLADGRVLEPEREQDLPPVLRRIANAFRPIFGKRKDFGPGMHAVVFRFDSAADEPRVDAPRPTTFALLVDDEPVVWQLPLAGVAPSSD
jgi:hypothetical protein